MKKIYIDGLGLVDGHFSGVGQYILGILKGMDSVIETKKYKLEQVPAIKVVIPRDSVKKFKKFGFKHIEYKVFPLPFRYMAALWHRNWLPPIDLVCGRGLYIFPRFVDMRLAFSQSAGLVVFDLSFELHRQYSDEINAKFLSNGVEKSVKRTRKVIAISKHAKQELMEFYALADRDVVVATPATDPSLFYRRSYKEIEDVKRRYNIEGEYILSLSNLEPRKNLDTLIDAYCLLPKEVTDKVALLLVGVNGWKTDELFAKVIERVEQGFNIIRPSKYISDSDKPAIISGAQMLAYPSHYEGFGMPPLEALACGTPVICSDNSSLPEVVGNAAKKISSNDTALLAEEMLTYLNDINSVTNKSIVEGPKQSSNFSWVKSAQIIFDEVLSQ